MLVPWGIRIEQESIDALERIADKYEKQSKLDCKAQDVARKAIREFIEKEDGENYKNNYN